MKIHLCFTLYTVGAQESCSVVRKFLILLSVKNQGFCVNPAESYRIVSSPLGSPVRKKVNNPLLVGLSYSY